MHFTENNEATLDRYLRNVAFSKLSNFTSKNNKEDRKKKYYCTYIYVASNSYDRTEDGIAN